MGDSTRHLKKIYSESLDFFFVVPFLNVLGIEVLKAPMVHPVSEALFNFAEAWIFMFLPLLLADPRGRLPKVPISIMAMFLTNVFLIPYMAMRDASPLPEENGDESKGLLARFCGCIGLKVGTVAIGWGILARPEFGNLTTRTEYFFEQLTIDRLTIAFIVDLVLFFILLRISAQSVATCVRVSIFKLF